jgi:hypothetical protein
VKNQGNGWKQDDNDLHHSNKELEDTNEKDSKHNDNKIRINNIYKLLVTQLGRIIRN